MAERNSNNGLYFIVGAIVVVVAFLFFFMSGGDIDNAVDAPAPAAEETNITIDATPDAPADAAPADAGVEPASN